MIEVTVEAIETVIREALRRYEEGRLDHGQLDLATREGILSRRQSKSYLTALTTVSFRY